METESETPVESIDMIVDPSAAYQSVSLLPDEMIKYELEPQGIASANTFPQRRKQLADVIKEKKYVSSRQPVAMGPKEDIGKCEEYVKLWREQVGNSSKTTPTINAYLIKVKFLIQRIENIQVPEGEEELRLHLEMLKKNVYLLLSHLQIADITIQHPQFEATHNKGILEHIANWSMEEEQKQALNNTTSSIKDPIQELISKGSRRRSYLELHEHSLLDASLDFYQTQEQINSRIRRPNNLINSTQSQTFHRSRNVNTPFSSGLFSSQQYHKPKVQIWKWNLKFYGEPNSVSVVEFIRRVRELAKSRGASLLDLFDSASDLFEGSALKWYRAGTEEGNFSCWEDIEKGLKLDFERYDYGDNLFDYIKSRIQSQKERIVVYFAIMEDLFLKLNTPVNENLKVKIIRKNLKPEFIRGLGFQACSSVYELKACCKTLEADLLSISERNMPINSIGMEPQSRHVRFDNKVYTSEDSNRFESNFQNNHYGNGQFRSRSPGFSSQYRNKLDGRDRQRSPSPAWRRQEKSFDQRMDEFSFQDEHKLPSFSVPPPSFTPNNARGNNGEANSFGNNRNSNQSYSDQRYFAPNRQSNNQGSSSDNQSSSNFSGNELGSYRQRATNTPQPQKRPY